jgi:hypothetical protein
VNDIVATNAQLPAHLQGVVGKEVFEEFAGGVQSGFPVISYRGKVWRVRKSGEEQMHVDTDGNALPTIEIVLLKSNERPSKTCYDSGYTEGEILVCLQRSLRYAHHALQMYGVPK